MYELNKLDQLLPLSMLYCHVLAPSPRAIVTVPLLLGLIGNVTSGASGAVVSKIFPSKKCFKASIDATGRSGRYGRKGLAIDFVTKQDIFFMQKIESHYKIDIKELLTNVRARSRMDILNSFDPVK